MKKMVKWIINCRHFHCSPLLHFKIVYILSWCHLKIRKKNTLRDRKASLCSPFFLFEYFMLTFIFWASLWRASVGSGPQESSGYGSCSCLDAEPPGELEALLSVLSPALQGVLSSASSLIWQRFPGSASDSVGVVDCCDWRSSFGQNL